MNESPQHNQRTEPKHCKPENELRKYIHQNLGTGHRGIYI